MLCRPKKMYHQRRRPTVDTNVNVDNSDTGFVPRQWVSQSPKKSTVTVRKKRDRLRNTDSVFLQALPTRLSSTIRPPLHCSSTDATTSSSMQSHSRNSRPVSYSSYSSDVPRIMPRQSSLKHRMLNRLASGLAPPNTALSRSPDSQSNEPHNLLESRRQQIARAVLDIHQADVGMNNSVFFAIDVGCALEVDGQLPLSVAIIVDNS